MNKTISHNKTSKKYKDAPLLDMDKLAEKWVEMMIEMLLTKDKKGLQKSDIFPKLDSA